VRAYDASTGGLLWTGPSAGTAFRASAAVSDGVVYGGSDDGTVFAFSLP
jgi:outer membrane protein assembly factor BamB